MKRPPTEAVYLRADERAENVVLRCVPTPVITGMIANAIPVAIIPYSIPVAAPSSFKNLIIKSIVLDRHSHGEITDGDPDPLIKTGDCDFQIRPAPNMMTAEWSAPWKVVLPEVWLMA
jgi:hypothetical protein